MDNQIKILLIIIGIIFVLYLTKPSIADCRARCGEKFNQYPVGYNDITDRTLEDPNRGPIAKSYYDNIYAGANESNHVPAYYDDLDPESLAKLKRSILTNADRTSKAELAYNDLAADRFIPGEVRPFNDAESRITRAKIDDPAELNDQYDNSYYDSWIATDAANTAEAEARAREIENTQLNCVDFKNINQCMSTCTETPDCRGFTVNKTNPDGSGNCCMMIDPPFAYERYSLDKVPDNRDYVSYRYLNNLMREKAREDGLPTFTKVQNNKNDGTTYNVDVSRTECKAFCPKCITGKCPDNYRCVDLQSDPRYNQTCLITNEDRYNEITGNLFDDDSVPSLEQQYGLDEYAGYDDLNTIPITSIPPNYNISLQNGIIPNKFDPRTWGQGPLAAKQIDALRKAEERSGQPEVADETAHLMKVAREKAVDEIDHERGKLVRPVIAEGFSQGYSDWGLNPRRGLVSSDKIYNRYVQNQPCLFKPVDLNCPIPNHYMG
jgi:hypothetical protein